jgi:hypothetical protein
MLRNLKDLEIRGIGIVRRLDRSHRAGELPKAKPSRPQGLSETLSSPWDWATPKAYLHDEIASDKRNPRLMPMA